jgi:3-oxoacyl-[acyl-carrier protein] reductase
MSEQPVAVVTGASRGIGLGIADKLESAGFAAVRTAKSWDEPGPRRFASDVADLGSHASLVADILARFGRIDCLVNNAGIGSPVRGDFVQLAPETFDRVMNVNLRGTVFFTQAVAALAGGAFPFSTGTVIDAGGGLTIPRL